MLPAGAADAQDERQAHELIYDAWDAPSRTQRVRLAIKALKLWPDCADAWSILAEEAAKTNEEVLECYRRAVAAGERALGETAFEEDVGHFWGLLETRPYMRARAGLAMALDEAGHHDEAINHYRELLRLNPGDNQGIRYTLLRSMIRADRDDEAWEFVNDSPGEMMAAWLYPKALLAFRRDGATAKVEGLLREAIGRNRFVPDYLLGRKRIPRDLPPYIGLGDEDEAVAFASENVSLWERTPGVMQRLERITG